MAVSAARTVSPVPAHDRNPPDGSVITTETSTGGGGSGSGSGSGIVFTSNQIRIRDDASGAEAPDTVIAQAAVTKKRAPPQPDGNGRKKPISAKKKHANAPHREQQDAKKDHDEPLLPVPGSYAHPDMQTLFNISIDPAPSVLSSSDEHRVKRKVALLLAYVGTDYAGFQMNAGQKTLQAELELALYKAGLLLPSNFGVPPKYGFSVAGRTDKGVHAAAQVCSLKLELPNAGANKDGDAAAALEQARHDINAHLPTATGMQVLDLRRVTRGFCAHTSRDRVRYRYVFPSFLLADVQQTRNLFSSVQYHRDLTSPGRPPLTTTELAAIRPRLLGFRSTAEQRHRLQAALTAMQGTHAFHNFTRQVAPAEARAMRYIVSFDMEPQPLVLGGLEWISCHVLGQSFLLNQIRKMMSLAIDVGRGVANVEVVQRTLSKQSIVKLNVAPPQGLFLERSYYQGYNDRKNRQVSDLPDLTDWWQEEDDNHVVYQRWHDFCQNKIIKHIVAEEEREGNFVTYMFAQEHMYDYEQCYAAATEHNTNDEING